VIEAVGSGVCDLGSNGSVASDKALPCGSFGLGRKEFEEAS